MAGQIQRMPLMDSLLTESSAVVRTGTTERAVASASAVPKFPTGPELPSAFSPSFSPSFLGSPDTGFSVPWELAGWLDVSWFYPDGFRKERRIETPAATIVVGASLVYSFLKPADPEDTPADRYKRACHEIADHQYLAPDLYLGIRLLRWEDGEPRWLAEIPRTALSSAELPADADEVVVVMRKVAANRLLSALLVSDDELTTVEFDHIADRLLRFYRRQIRNRPGATKASSEMLPSIQLRLNGIQQFVASYASLLDAISSSSLRHCMGYLTTFLELRGRELTRRQKLGMIVDGHGNLSARNILTESPIPGGKAISLLHRAPRWYRRRDVLSDVADLAVDFEIYGCSFFARTLEARLFGALPQAFDAQWYRFYCVLSALTQVTELFEREDATDHDALSRALAAAVRHSFGLSKPFGVLVVDPSASAGLGVRFEDRALKDRAFEDRAEDPNLDVQYLIECLSELGGMLQLNRVVQNPDLPGYLPLRDTLFERLLQRARIELENEHPVVLRWPCTEEQIFTLRKLFHRLELPWVVVRLDGSRQPPVRPDSNFAPPVALEPLMPQPELALYVLSELAKIARKVTSDRTNLAFS